MKCANCSYYERGVCYKKGTRVSFDNNICEKFIYVYDNKNDEINDFSE